MQPFVVREQQPGFAAVARTGKQLIHGHHWGVFVRERCTAVVGYQIAQEFAGTGDDGCFDEVEEIDSILGSGEPSQVQRATVELKLDVGIEARRIGPIDMRPIRVALIDAKIERPVHRSRKRGDRPAERRCAIQARDHRAGVGEFDEFTRIRADPRHVAAAVHDRGDRPAGDAGYERPVSAVIYRHVQRAVAGNDPRSLTGAARYRDPIDADRSVVPR